MALSDKLQISVYRADTLTRVGLISSWVSLSWAEYYKKNGMMQLEVMASEEMAALLSIGRYCGLTGRSVLMWIRNVQLRDGKLIVTAYTLDRVLEERVHNEVIPVGTAVESKFREVITKMSPWPRMQLGESAGIDDKTTKEIKAKTAAQASSGLIGDSDAGLRVRHDKEQKMLYIELYKPGESGIKYGSLYGNVGDVTMTVNDLSYKNVATVEGPEEKEDGEETGTRITVQIGDTQASGENRREAYIDASSIAREEEENDASFRRRITEYGEAKLAEYAIKETLAMSVVDERADVGDVIPVNLREIGMKASVRITGIKITAQRGKVKRELITGDPYDMIRRLQ